MTEFQLTLTPDEHEFLIEQFEEALKETRVEEHRTRKPTFREGVLHREELLIGLLDKLHCAESACAVHGPVL